MAFAYDIMDRCGFSNKVSHECLLINGDKGDTVVCSCSFHKSRHFLRFMHHLQDLARYICSISWELARQKMQSNFLSVKIPYTVECPVALIRTASK